MIAFKATGFFLPMKKAAHWRPGWALQDDGFQRGMQTRII
jgi:hypothetical protein